MNKHLSTIIVVLLFSHIVVAQTSLTDKLHKNIKPFFAFNIMPINDFYGINFKAENGETKVIHYQVASDDEIYDSTLKISLSQHEVTEILLTKASTQVTFFKAFQKENIIDESKVETIKLGLQAITFEKLPEYYKDVPFIFTGAKDSDTHLIAICKNNDVQFYYFSSSVMILPNTDGDKEAIKETKEKLKIYHQIMSLF